MPFYEGHCLCGATTFTARGEPIAPHLCSCTMCQKSSGAPTVAWVSFSLDDFEWGPQSSLGRYRSSAKTQRCFCQQCGSFLCAIDDGVSQGPKPHRSWTSTQLQRKRPLLVGSQSYTKKEAA